MIKLAETDIRVRSYLLWLLIQLCAQNNQTLALPNDLQTTRIANSDYNANKVQEKLAEINPFQPTQPHTTTEQSTTPPPPEPPSNDQTAKHKVTIRPREAEALKRALRPRTTQE